MKAKNSFLKFIVKTGLQTRPFIKILNTNKGKTLYYEPVFEPEQPYFWQYDRDILNSFVFMTDIHPR